MSEPEKSDHVPYDPATTAWRRAARRHQDGWRDRHGWPAGRQRVPVRKGGGFRTIGSRVEEAYAVQHGVNFIHPWARDAAIDRLKTPQRLQTLDAERLHTDLLSSMPMCFNLFGPLWASPRLAADATARWFPDLCDQDADVTVGFEWSPGRRSTMYLPDRTAFDAVMHVTAAGRRALIGIETKYHEAPRRGHARRRDASSLHPRYLELTEGAALFDGPGWASTVVGTELEQLWRDHLLAIACQVAANDPIIVRYVLVAPAANPSWRRLAERYTALLRPEARTTFTYVTVEELFQRAPGVLPHEDTFRARYLDVDVDVPPVEPPLTSDRPNDTKYVYVIGEKNTNTAVKIGIANRRGGRIAKLNTGNPRELELLFEERHPHGRWVEYQLHCALAPWRARPNGEWFDVRALAEPGTSDAWRAFLARVLAGEVPGAAPLPLPPPQGEHAVVHIEGLPRALVACCRCGWRSKVGVMTGVLQDAAGHIDSGRFPSPSDRTDGGERGEVG